MAWPLNVLDIGSDLALTQIDLILFVVKTRKEERLTSKQVQLRSGLPPEAR